MQKLRPIVLVTVSGIVIGMFLKLVVMAAWHMHDRLEAAFFKAVIEPATWQQAWPYLGLFETYRPLLPWIGCVCLFIGVDMLTRTNFFKRFPTFLSMDQGEPLAFGIREVDNRALARQRENESPEAASRPPGYMNPYDPEPPAVQTGKVPATLLTRIAIAAQRCYDQYDLGMKGPVGIYFQQSSEYVDSFLEVTMTEGMVAEIYVAFTYPPAEDTGWLPYAVRIEDPEDLPDLLALEEIDENGHVTQLSATELNWLADEFIAVCALPTTPNNTRPHQAAPTTMY